MLRYSLMVLLGILCVIPAAAQRLSIYGNVPFNQDVPRPDEVLGFALGSRPVSHAQAVSYLKAVANASEWVELVEAGETHEGRTLYYLIVSSRQNMAALSAIKIKIGKLADPRQLTGASESTDIVRSTPAVAFMMYSIHGDEISGTDASLLLAHRLAAGLDSAAQRIRDNVVTIIYPMENPDGRDRFVAKYRQWTSLVPSTDIQSMPHTTDCKGYFAACVRAVSYFSRTCASRSERFSRPS